MKIEKKGYQEPGIKLLLLEEEDVIAGSGLIVSSGDGSNYDWSDFFDEDF